MDIDVNYIGSATVLQPEGRIDQNTASQFQSTLLSQIEDLGKTPLILKMDHVEFISSIGLRAIMMAFKQSKANGGTLLIAELTPLVKEVFQISRFDTVIPCFDDIDGAVKEAQAH